MADKPSTRQLLEKIPNYPCLYRHTVNATYYGIKKIGSKRKEHSLQTTDRKIAERRLKKWLEDLEKVDTAAEKTSLSDLVKKFLAANEGKGDKTKATNISIVSSLKKTWPYDLEMRVSEVRPSQLNEWLALHESRLKNTSYNRYAGFLKQLFEIAVLDRMVAQSPFDGVKTKWKKPQAVIRNVPTLDQFHAIVADVRAQKFNADAEETADFLEFLGLAGVGQAETSNLIWDDIDWLRERIRIRRRKTQAIFYVPIYPHLRPFLERLQKTLPQDFDKMEKVFKIKDGKRALAAACSRLNFKKFSQRNLRQVLIRRLWQSGVDYKLISKWQGHQDGGKLILDTYTEVFGDSDADYEKAQLLKIT